MCLLYYYNPHPILTLIYPHPTLPYPTLPYPTLPYCYTLSYLHIILTCPHSQDLPLVEVDNSLNGECVDLMGMTEAFNDANAAWITAVSDYKVGTPTLSTLPPTLSQPSHPILTLSTHFIISTNTHLSTHPILTLSTQPLTHPHRHHLLYLHQALCVAGDERHMSKQPIDTHS